MDYGQFCPVAKASELLGERWMLLIVRELMLGSHRYSELQRGLSRISPSLLSKRLKELEAAGVIVSKPAKGGRSREYFLTAAGKELQPLIEQLAVWGMRWAKGQLRDEELDVEFLMWDIQRRIDRSHLPDGEWAFCFIFEDIARFKHWWLLVKDSGVDLCTESPGVDVDLYVRCTLRDLVRVWDGELSTRSALGAKIIQTQGNPRLAKSMPDWLGVSPFAGLKAGDPALKLVAAED